MPDCKKAPLCLTVKVVQMPDHIKRERKLSEDKVAFGVRTEGNRVNLKKKCGLSSESKT